MAKKKSITKPKSSPKPKSQIKSLPDWLTNTRMHLIVLFLLSFLLYANTFGHDYAQDDAIVITENMFTKEGLNGISGIFSKDTFFGFFKVEGKDKLVSGGRYRPFTLLLFAIEYQFFGENPMIGHVMNALYYGLTVLVLYLVLLYLFNHQLPANRNQAYVVALLSSLLFATHPIHTEAVANIKGRDEIFALLGSLSALLLCLKAYREKKGVLWLIGAGVCLLIGLLSKENTITFLAVIPFAFYFFTKASIKKILISMLPIIGATVLFMIIRTSILGLDFGAPSRELMNNPFLKLVNGTYVDFTAGEKLATIFFTLGKYLLLLFFPHPLSHDYYPRQIDVMTFGNGMVILSLLVYIALGVYALLGIKKKDPISFAIIYFLATLSIVSNIVFPVGTNMSERFLFMPSVGFCMAIGVLAFRLCNKGTSFQLLPVYLIVAISLFFSVKTITRNFIWKNNYTLFTNDVKTSSESAKLRNAVGG
ncbi:MAG: tetratricopeptide repeat protein, partial [Bacteroidota bacterium]